MCSDENRLCNGDSLGGGSKFFYHSKRDDLNALGFQLKMMSANEHDHMMHFIQGIQHFSTYAVGSFLQKHDLKPESFNVLVSPIYALELQLMRRIFDQDASLYADLDSTPGERLECAREFLLFHKTCLINQRPRA